ncbi:MAG: hypothetical protein IIU11_02640, partial [Bacteroidales bacterium]|nr:hypothetical protein [Bacteroidales bacterium]
MKKALLASLLALSALGINSCTDNELNNQIEIAAKSLSFSANFPGEDDDNSLSKAYVSASASNNTAVDKIVVYGNYSRWRPFVLNLNNGVYTGTGDDDVVYNSSTFVGLWPDGFRQDDGNFKMTFPSRQEAVANWYGSSANLMIAQCNANNKKFDFQKVYSCIRLYVYENFDEITIKAYNGDTYL